MIALDTSIVIDAIRETRKGRSGPVTRRLEELGKELVALPVFVLCELELGASRARDPDSERTNIRRFAERCEILYPDDRFAHLYGDVAARLLDRGRPMATMDLLIAVSSIVAGARLLTRERRGFEGIPGLTVERC